MRQESILRWNKEKNLLKEVNCIMVANWMHRNLGKSNSIFSFESVGIICQKGDSLKKKKKGKRI